MNQEVQAYQGSMAVGEVANVYAAQNVFSVYQTRIAKNTLRRQADDLALFSRYLACAGLSLPAEHLLNDPDAWQEITYGLVEGFIRWQLQEGYAIGSINVRLSTVKRYCALATKARMLSAEAMGLIRLVQGFRYTEGRNVDTGREQVRREGAKKAEPVQLSKEQVSQLKAQPDTPQGRRDTLLLCLLLDHGLRCGEIASLTGQAVNIAEGKLTFYREKVGIQQIHDLTRDTLIAAVRYFEVCPRKKQETLLAGSRKSRTGNRLEGNMSTRAITERVRILGELIGVQGLSAHDGRHAWATSAIRGGTDLKSLQDAGGWKSIAMPARYAASQQIANKGVKLG